MLVEGPEYRRINARRLKPGQYLQFPGKWDGMREITASESKTKKRVVLAAGVFGFIVGITGALLLDHLLLTTDAHISGGAGQAATERLSTMEMASADGEAESLPGAAQQENAPRVRSISLLRVTADDVNLRAGPARTESAIARLKRGTDLIEINRTGNWVEVELPSMKGKRGWIHESMVGPGTFETATITNDARAGESPRLVETAIGLTSDGKCQRASGDDKHPTNCLQRGDNDGAPDKALDIFQDIIKLKKYDCDGRIEAASYVNEKEKRIFLVQCGESPRYKIEIIGNELNIVPVHMSFHE